MKFTFSHLKQFLQTDATIQQIASALTMLGHEVESINDKAKELKGFIVAKILATTKHPDADKLQICEVSTGTEKLQIICGAPNARAGIKVVLARIGTEIPNGKFKIKETKIRGIVSQGMLCSSSELLIDNDDAGIIELPQESILGHDFASSYGYDDPVIHLNITPNRGDCLGVYGIARELAAKGLGILINIHHQLKHLYNQSSTSELNPDCPLLIITRISKVKNVPSPIWLQNLLRNIGLKSISAIVDVTNYICYSYGYPIHAYDASKLPSHIIHVRYANSGDKYVGLDNKSYILESNDLIITSQNKIIGLAGIIGALDTGCDHDTQEIILETAWFNPKVIMNTGRRLHIDSDARHRFERHVDYNLAIYVHEIACEMITSICSGEIINSIVDGNIVVPLKFLYFHLSLFAQKTGITTLSQNTIENILTNLGFKIEASDGEQFKILVPSWRSDISIEEDIVEEILRIYGYENLPEIRFQSNLLVNKILSSQQRRIFDVKRIISSIGYREVVSWSFINSKLAQEFDTYHQELQIINPISQDLDYMRPSIIPNLLEYLRKNHDRSIKNLSFFEVGPIFLGAFEKSSLSAVRCSNVEALHPFSKIRSYDIFDLKYDIETIFTELGINFQNCKIISDTKNYYHPGRSGTILLGKLVLGYFGELHPEILNKFHINNRVLGFEILLSDFPDKKLKYGLRDAKSFSAYQPIERDFAFIVDLETRSIDMIKCLQQIDPRLIKKVEIFDIYTGEKIASNKKSIAFRLTIQSDEATLADEISSTLCSNIISTIESKFNAKIRDK